jgi:hypothetical protein
VSKDTTDNGKKVNGQKNSSKLKREDRLASALKKNIKLRKENKNNR